MADPTVNTVDPTQLRIAQGQATLPSSNADLNGAEPTQSSPTGNQLQSPAQTSAQQPLQLQPSQSAVTTPAQPPTSNPKLFGFIGSVLHGTLRALAGPQQTTYTTDKDGRIIKDPNQPADTVGAQGRRLAAHALEGLAAGAQVPQQKSGAASALSGLGAGYSAATASASAADAKSRQQARENEEAAQQKILRRAQTARENVLTYTNFKHMIAEDLDRDPERKGNLDLVQAAKDSDIPVTYVTESELKQQLQDDTEKVKQDPSHDGIISSHRILPVDLVPVKGPDGLPLTDENGIPRMEGKFALIDGYHDGNIKLPASFVTDVQKYVSGTEGLKPGEEMSSEHFKTLRAEMLEGKKQEMAGWAKPELGWQGDTPIQINSNNPTKTRPFAPGIVPNVENKPADAAAQKKLRESQKALDDAKTKEAITNTSLLAQQLNSGGSVADLLPQYHAAIQNLPDAAQKLLKAVPPAYQLTVLKVAAGDEDVKDATKNPRKGMPTLTVAQLSNLASLVNPNWTGQLYQTKQKLVNDFTSGPASQQINSLNQFLGHAGQASDIINKFRTTQSPFLNRSINWLRANAAGDKDVYALLQALEPVRDEYLNMIKSGKAATKEEIERSYKTLNEDMPVSALLGNLSVAGEQGVTRIDQLNEQWKQVTGVNAPNLVRQTGLDGAKKLGIGNAVSKYNTGGQFGGANNPSPQSGQTQNGQNQPTTQNQSNFAPDRHVFDAKAWAAANPGKDVNAAIAKAQKQGFEVKQ